MPTRARFSVEHERSEDEEEIEFQLKWKIADVSSSAEDGPLVDL